MPGIQTLILYFTLFVSLFFEIFLLITYFEVREEIAFEAEHSGSDLTDFPSVTIIVPSFNEEKTVRATVESLLELAYPKNKLTLLLVDDGSTDRTLEVLNEFKNNPQIKIFSKANEGSKFAALNFALKHTTSELVGCLDADSFVDPNALKHIIPYFKDKKIMAVTPSIKVHEPKTILQHVQKVEYSWGVFLRRMLSAVNALYVTPGPFSIFRTTVFQELGGYRHAHHTEDMELALRMQKNDYKIVNALGAHVYTVAPDKLPSLVKQRTRWSYGFLNNAIDYRDMYFNKKYGNIGVFVLPIATLSIFTTLYAASNFIWNFGKSIVKSIKIHQATGWGIGLPHHFHLSFDWFYVNTNSVALVSSMTILLSLIMLSIALKMSN
ncbi:MAG: hypothetical protein JWN50_324, partial [Parcubacteria group bacterium]|nr:hypothetical protein [Parcubacteria group bacterium]